MGLPVRTKLLGVSVLVLVVTGGLCALAFNSDLFMVRIFAAVATFAGVVLAGLFIATAMRMGKEGRS